jgi:hypothetical protein
MSDFEREVLVILLKQACESGNDAKAAVEEAVTAYQSLSERLQAVPPEKRLA